MPTYRLERFPRLSVLRQIEQSRLIELLTPFRSFLEGRGLFLPGPDELPFRLDYDALCDVLMTPGEDTPNKLLDALYYIDELSTEATKDELLEDPELRREVGNDATAADVVLLAWLRKQEKLEKKHAEVKLQRRRSFDSFLATSTGGIELFTKKRLKHLQAALDRWFADHQRGRGCRVFDYPREGETWLLIRHGAGIRREESLVDGEPSSVYFRPGIWDVLVYNDLVGELRMNTENKGEKKLYREYIGLYIFSDVAHFPGTQKFTLEPLRSKNRGAIVCSDIEGIDWVTLKEIQYYWPGKIPEVEIRKSADIFSALEARQESIPTKARIIGAGFSVKFADAKTPRSVTVRLPNVANYTRDDDGELVEKWLDNQGFILGSGG